MYFVVQSKVFFYIHTASTTFKSAFINLHGQLVVIE